MYLWAIVLLAVLVGVVIGILIGSWFWNYQRKIKAVGEPAGLAITDQAASGILAVSSAAMLVGNHDEVRYSSPAAHTLGVVRGSRIVVSELLKLIRKARQQQANLTSELQLVRPGVKPIPLQIRVGYLGGGNLLVVIHDLSYELRMDAARRDFVANISHELKTPIGAISVLSEAVSQASGDPDQVLEFANRLQFESSRLTDLVNQIIELSRLQASNSLANHTIVDLTEVINEAIGYNQEVAVARKINITTHFGENCMALGDKGQLVDAVSNLVANAIAYSDEYARVAIVTNRVPNEDSEAEVVEVVVSDNGIGIKPEDQKRVFERFFRVDYSRSRESGGTGLGLAIVKHIMVAHGGSVKVWSKPGEGSTFTLQLPALSAEPDSQ
ncbi:MAG: two-component sensor histidine kinase [Propionibacterium sp.]|nr:MAG: two-component sensor histidine kinase [Propionibacterium sp.]